jgi:Protein of unknown function (DUF4058)
MQRLISPNNQYMGINAHLHSHFLHSDSEGWEEFHSDHITDLTRAMNVQLMAMGYIARKERSLQIRYFDEKLRAPISDVLIQDRLAQRQRATPQPIFDSSLVMRKIPASALLEFREIDAKRPTAIKIYERDDDEERGKPVAWIELLSPSNKSDAGYRQYTAKRDALLGNRLVFVEIDYLQGISTTLEKIPDYIPRDHQTADDAHPYHIWLIDPRLPHDDERSGAIAAFDVDQPIPLIPIPLNHGDHLTCDFNAVYHQTFRVQPAYSLAVNYFNAPENVEQDYNLRDRVAIAARMITVQQLAQAGVNVAESPHPIDSSLLETLIQQPERVAQILALNSASNGSANDLLS